METDVRYASGHKEQTRRQIVGQAARVLRRDGLIRPSVGQIMGEVGLTVGGFYSHFDSKEALIDEALSAAFAQALADRAEGLDPDTDAWLSGFVDRYLSAEHCRDIEHGCPMSALASEIARSDETTRRTFDAGLQDVITALSSRLKTHHSQAIDVALAITALCVGGMSLARATADQDLANHILRACQGAVTTVTESTRQPSGRSQPSHW